MKRNRYGKIRHNAITLLWIMTAVFSLLKLLDVTIPTAVLYGYGIAGIGLIAVMLYAGIKGGRR